MRHKICLILLISACFVQEIVGQEIYTNEKYGFSIEEPNGWTQELNRTNYFNLDVPVGNNIITFYKYKRGTSSEINSTINISVSNNSSKPENFVKRMLKASKWNETYYLTHSFAKKPEVIMIDGKEAVTATVHFSYNSHSTRKTTFRKRIYYILHGKKLYKLAFIDDYALDVDTKVFDAMVQSIKIGK